MKDIVGYEGFYKVTENGEVYSIRSDKFLKLNYKKNGYVYVELNVNGVSKTHRVHRLVGRAYIPNPNKKPYINHIDGDKSNNNINNLEWVTAKENVEHAIRNGLDKPTFKEYIVTNIYDNSTITCLGFLEVENVVDVKSSQISNLLDTGKKSRGGYVISSKS